MLNLAEVLFFDYITLSTICHILQHQPQYTFTEGGTEYHVICDVWNHNQTDRGGRISDGCGIEMDAKPYMTIKGMDSRLNSP